MKKNIWFEDHLKQIKDGKDKICNATGFLAKGEFAKQKANFDENR